MDPLVSVGLSVFNGKKHIRETLDSLLAQTYTNFELIISDNASTDGTFQICQEYALKDKRISIYKNKCNLGGIENFRIVFMKGCGKYFMWASDHDVWHPEWIQKHVDVLNNHPDVVMVYPLSCRISDTGEIIEHKPEKFDTFRLGVDDRIKMIYSESKKPSELFGSMVYGLFRAEILRKANVYPRLIHPDYTLFWELTLYGSIKQIQEELWFRRYIGLWSFKRAKRTTFDKPPWYTYLLWPFVNTTYLMWRTVLHPSIGGFHNRYLGLRLSFNFLKVGLFSIDACYPRLAKCLSVPYRIGKTLMRKRKQLNRTLF